MDPGTEHAVGLSEQFLTRVAADLAQAVIGIGDVAGRIGDADDRMLVESEHLVFDVAAQAFAVLEDLGDHAQHLGHAGIAVVHRFQADAAQQAVGGAAQHAQAARLLVGQQAQVFVGLIQF